MSRSKYRNLIIIGNGFDCWQGIPTSYENFRLYYAEHIYEVANSLGCKLYTVTDKNGNDKKITAVEIIYGDPFNPDNLESEFFWHLESRMDKLDDQIINMFFGRTTEGIKTLRHAVVEAISLLRRLFCDWVTTLNIDIKDSGYKFTNDCFVINFNYTDTIEKRFALSSSNVFHIHGSADDVASIIVGHSTHPEKPFKELIERHFIRSIFSEGELPRINGLYAVEEALYKTDKHTADNIDRLCVKLMKKGIHIEDFENIYVLGHSFAEADMDYFDFINSVTRCGCNFETISPTGHFDKGLLAALLSGEEIGEDILMNTIALNIEYAIQHRSHIVEHADDLFPEYKVIDELLGDNQIRSKKEAEYAVKQRFWFEQAKRTHDVLEKLAKEYHVPVPKNCHSILGYMDYVDYGHDQRRRNPTWYISYHSEDDKKRIKRVMRELDIKRYKLYDTIDDCIAEFRK